ncbi:serine carboxypeptidase-like 18 [Oryza brachyantha]|uniref:serine carboxypeptidase-like 18 n=1 Tax=Oryza brachyantha TaxID=4533 RepID=UPI000776A6AE|nr:serine carboxypeptidase-like 18 [Oryza brachyantha]
MSVRLACLLLCCRILAAADRTNVATLPGLDGALPSRLETGYVTVDEEHGAELFYYFVESEGDPGTDPVLLWLNGGNRCSVLSALFFEIGPVKLVIEPYNGGLPRLRYHPYSWTKVTSIIFVDSPVGAGFSFSRDPGGYNVGDVSSTLQLVKFVNKWFVEHPEFLANPLYVGGESYAGKLVPFLVQKISEDTEAGVKPVPNLKGYLVGNPSTGESIDHDTVVPYAHGVGIISDQLYETILENCGRGDYANPKNGICAQAMNRFNDLIGEVWGAHILYKNCIDASPKPDDATAGRKILKEEIVVQNRLPPRPAMDCQTYPNYLSYFWANSNITRETLRIKKGTVDEWVRCDDDGLLPYSGDLGSIIKYHRNLTSRGYRVLVYSGDHDSIVPFLGTQAWVRSLNYPILDDWRAWHTDGQSAGFTVTYANSLTFATIKGGGHTAPEYQPERCLAMFGRWISEKPL